MQKLTRSGLGGVSERDVRKKNLPFSRLQEILYLRGETCLQNVHFYKQKGPCLRRPLNWTGSVSPLLKRPTLYMGKSGTIWQFFRALFPSTWRTLSPDALFTSIWDTRKHPDLPHFRAFPASIQEHSHLKCLFSWQTRNCQIVPVLPSYLYYPF